MKGICFVEPLFHKVVKREKTQTRRIVPMPKWANVLLMDSCGLFAYDAYENTKAPRTQYLKPKYKLNEVVFLKEPYKIIRIDTEWYVRYKFIGSIRPVPLSIGPEKLEKLLIRQEKSKSGWLNKLFMPEWAAGHFVKITSARAERLRDITNIDCRKEGVEICKECIPGGCSMGESCAYPRLEYSGMIDRINRKGTWKSNPFVWVYDFEQINKENI